MVEKTCFNSKANGDNYVIQVGSRLKEARKALGLTQDALANLAGAKSKSGLQDNEAGKNMPGGQMIGAMVKAGINANWLLTGEGEMFINSTEHENTQPSHEASPSIQGYVAIQGFEDVCASAGPGLAIHTELPSKAFIFNEDWVRYELRAKPQDLNLIRVSGDSMEPTLRSGDMVLVDMRYSNPNHEGIYILRMNGMLMVKRLNARPGGVICVTSDNPLSASFEVNLSQLSDGDDFAIIGRVVWSGRMM